MENLLTKTVSKTSPCVVVALDYDNVADALAMVHKLSPQLCRLKVGKELFTLAGPGFVETLHKLGYEVFLDLKFHDIPNTTAQAVKAAANLGVWMLNVHASGGPVMLEAAANALQHFTNKPLLIAVTVLTSLSQQQLQALGVAATIDEQVLRLARLTQEQGLDGVVCSALETQLLRQTFGAEFCLVTPGIRPQGSAQDDQTRIVTPQQALQWGSDYLVMGRPIRNHPQPKILLQEIHDSLAQLGV